MSEQTQQQVELENNYRYRDQHRRVSRWNIILAVIAVGFALILLLINITARQPKYYATTVNGYVSALHPLSEPIVTNHVLLQWAQVAARSAYNFGFAHEDNEIQTAKNYFTPNAWQQFLKALKDSGLKQDIEDNKLIMNSVVSGTPVILSQGIEKGRYTWTLQMPLLLTFTSANQETKGHLIVTMDVSRVPILSAPKGIQITNFVANYSLGQLSNTPNG